LELEPGTGTWNLELELELGTELGTGTGQGTGQNLKNWD